MNQDPFLGKIRKVIGKLLLFLNHTVISFLFHNLFVMNFTFHKRIEASELCKRAVFPKSEGFYS